MGLFFHFFGAKAAEDCGAPIGLKHVIQMDHSTGQTGEQPAHDVGGVIHYRGQP
jgi:hypothetical protein